MRQAVNWGALVGVYLAWGMVSCAEADTSETVTVGDASLTALDAPDAPDVVSEDNPAAPADVVFEDTVTPAADVVTDVPAVQRDAAPIPDSIPTESVMFFQGTTCPSGWEAYRDGAGRAVAVAANPALNGYRLGTQLADREERGHAHGFGGAFTLDGVSYVGVVGGGNSGTSAAGEVRFRAQTSMASAGLPYVQLLVCRKTGPTIPRAQPLPSGMMIFFSGARCPAGYTQPVGTRGRVLVGLPPGGANGAVFGAAPLGADNPAQHTHPTTTELATAGHGIALASGCCGSGYARNGTYQAMGRTDANEPGMPTIQLLQCQKD